MKQNKSKIFIAIACALIITLSMTLFVSFSLDTDVQKVIVKSMSVVYDEDSTVTVENNKTTFNDKDQEVKYKVVLENTQSYSVKLEDIKLSTPSEEFLVYEIENFSKGDLIDENGTKEIIVSFTTEKKEGWGRNFDDELTATLTFSKASKKEETKPVVKPEVKPEKEDKPIVEENKPSVENKPSEDVVVPDDDLTNNIEIEEEQEKLEEVIIDINDSDKEENNESWKLILLIILIILDIVFGTILIIKIKNRKGKIIGLVIIGLFSSVAIVNADELIEVPIKFNIAFKSQNVMKPSGWQYDEEYEITAMGTGMWQYTPQVVNVYIENDFRTIENPVYETDVSNGENGRVKAYFVKNQEKEYCSDINEEDAECLDLYLQADGIIYANENASFYFAMMMDLENIYNLDGFDTSKSTNMAFMFGGACARVQCLNIDFSKFNTSNVTDMGFMFYSYGYSSPKFVLDLSSFDTSKVESMVYMFHQAGSYSEEVSLNISSFDTSSVTTMNNMFSNSFMNADSVNLDLSGFDTSNVTDMNGMFDSLGRNAGELLLNLKSFNTSKVTDMEYMFNSIGVDTKNEFVLDLSSFDTSNVIEMSQMFRRAAAENEKFSLILGDGFKTDKVLYIDEIFRETGKEALNLDISITISNPNIESYHSMFIDTAKNGTSKITVNYIAETENIVDKMINAASSGANVVKGKLIVDVDSLSIGDEVHIAGEKFNVISQTDDEITMLAKYNLGTDYRQSTTTNASPFSSSSGWEYSPGPKEIDIQVWSTNPKKYVNEYVSFLNDELNLNNIGGDLISLNQLKTLGCVIPENYSDTEDENNRTCKDSKYKSWLVNGQFWWTKSAVPVYEADLWVFAYSGVLYRGNYLDNITVRPTITISKIDLKNYIEK